jgi:hypothetical protein
VPGTPIRFGLDGWVYELDACDSCAAALRGTPLLRTWAVHAALACCLSCSLAGYRLKRRRQHSAARAGPRPAPVASLALHAENPSDVQRSGVRTWCLFSCWQPA